MAITYTAKFAEKVDERFTPSSVTYAGVNQDYDFVGAQTIKITSVTTADNKDYNRKTGYGAAQQIENVIQEMTMTKDRGFKILLDKMDEEETKIKSGEVLARQLREKVIPEIEEYRLSKMLDSCKSTAVTGVAGKAYENFLAAQEKLDDAFIPSAGRVAFVTPAFLNQLKLNPNFVKASELAQGTILMRGQVGEVDGIPIIKTNKAWMHDLTSETAGKYDCLIAHRSATVAPIKLQEYRVVTDSEDYSGTLFLGRFYYDCFILDNKKSGLVAITRP